MTKHDEKVVIEKEKVALEKERIAVEKEKAHAAMMQADTARIQAMSEASQSVTRKMKEDSKILTADLSGYTPEVRAWFQLSQQRILRENGLLPPEPTGTTTTPMGTTATPMDTAGEPTTSSPSSEAEPTPGWQDAETHDHTVLTID